MSEQSEEEGATRYQPAVIEGIDGDRPDEISVEYGENAPLSEKMQRIGTFFRFDDRVFVTREIKYDERTGRHTVIAEEYDDERAYEEEGGGDE